MRFIGFQNLKEGMVVADDILSEVINIPLVKRNSILTANVINNLNRYHIKGIYINDDISKDIYVENNISSLLQSRIINALKNMKFEEIINSAKELVEIYLNLDNISFEKLNISNNMYSHSLNVCELSVAIGKEMGYNTEKLTNLAISALLHDIGKTCINNDLLSKINISSALSNKVSVDINSEDYHYYMHPVYGYNILSNVEGMNSTIRVGILGHHENENGTGFPLGLKSNEINEFSKIIHICDIYDDLITKYCPSEALGYIESESGALFDFNIVNVFSKYITIYPKGTTVILSNGLRALVLENNNENLLRPK